jgi:class 3 adenylate cyclase
VSDDSLRDNAVVLVVNDDPDQLETLIRMLTRNGHIVSTAESAAEARAALNDREYEVVLMDLVLPDEPGEEVVRSIRRQNTLNSDTPFLALTVHGRDREADALRAGSDDFISAPFDELMLLARIGIHTERIRAVRTLAIQAERLQRSFEEKSEELERVRQLQRFLPASLVRTYLADPKKLEKHRREIACLFLDLRDFTRFSGSHQPEEVENVIHEYHVAIEPVIRQFGATVGGLAGDGVMLYLNDPEPYEQPAVGAVQLALEAQQALRSVVRSWNDRGFELGCGAGVSYGWATMANIGFSTRRDYTPLGPAVNLASRLCNAALDGEILIDAQTRFKLFGLIATEAVDRELKGIAASERVFRVLVDR